MFNLIYDLPNSEYHSGEGTYSSSQLKTILEDPEVFHRKYVTGQEERLSIPAFDVGTYFHTAVLEPHLLEEECVVYQGVRRGTKWEKFQEDNSGKTIITANEHKVAEGLVDSVNRSPRAMELISESTPEVSAFVTVQVYKGDIYCNGLVLDTFNGWTTTDINTPLEDTVEICLKCRADALGENYILDLKSTTGNVKNEGIMRSKVSNYSYDLSAAMYLDIFSIALEKPLTDFYWTFGSKDTFTSQTYLASRENIQIGRAKWKKAVLSLAYYLENGWEFKDKVRTLGPSFFEREWIKTKEEDEL